MKLLTQCDNVHFLNAPAELDLQYSVQVLDRDKNLLSHWRIVDGRHFLFLCHNDNHSAKATVYLPGVTGRAMLLDPSTGEGMIPGTREEKDGLCVCLEFVAYGSLINSVEYPAGMYDVSLTDWSEWDILDPLFAGVVTYRTTVTLTETELSHHARLCLTPGSGSVGVTINGQDVGCKMFASFSFDIGGRLHAGDNIIELRVSNTILSNVRGKHGGLLGVEVLLLSSGACA